MYTGERENDTVEDDFGLLKTIRAEIRFDDRLTDHMVLSAYVFLVPFEIQIRRVLGKRRAILEGLVLGPTYIQNGQYQRIGWFEIEDKLEDSVEGSSAMDEDSESGSTHAESNARLDDSPNATTSYEMLEDSNEDTNSDIDDVYIEDENSLRDDSCSPAKSPATGEIPSSFAVSSIYHSLKEQGILEAWEEVQSLTEDDSTNDWDKDDPFCNGQLPRTLLNPFDPSELERYQYPQIYTFLVIIFLYHQDDPMSNNFRPFYEEKHEDGYCTIQII
jgi:hypothetical protein